MKTKINEGPMEKHRAKAWECLTDREKQSIYLTLGQGLSSNKASEMLNLTKYKFFELRTRAETFFKLYTDYFKIHKTLFRKGTRLLPDFKDFIEACLIQRKPLKDACIYAGEGKWAKSSVRKKSIIKGLEYLRDSEHLHDNHLFRLIHEFDRWNNFRILPPDLRTPSPYKRRNRKLLKRQLKDLYNMSDATLERIHRTCVIETNRVNNVAYIPLFSVDYPVGYKVSKIDKNNPFSMKLLCKRSIPIFDNKDVAIEFAIMVIKYFTVKTSKTGKYFWDVYKELIKQSSNFDLIDYTMKYVENSDDSKFRKRT